MPMSDRLNPRPPGMELAETTPTIVGGNPNDPENKVRLTRQQHFEMVRYWNRVISDLRKQDEQRGSPDRVPAGSGRHDGRRGD